MKLIIGLGNPGENFNNNRHNVGKMVIGKFKAEIQRKDVVTREPDVFMNDSGSFVLKQLINYNLNPHDLYIIHDDLDIKLGEYKIQLGKGPKDNNGINDIEDKLKTKDFWRIRVGVDNRDIDNRITGEQYVLEDFADEEKVIINQVISKIVTKLLNIN